ncbi:hypothetical protein M3194_08560 [Paenibacillus glycanilyticus]|uniref:hypothetical protein n=1 Tax=Paenibacillus glycanilyticus TaxID=126569 RepID=UPI00203C4747|nr:hypothetical protein [Paenibacillus glycanilyticus]MCM3627415.1 hypothetical protein [Paenibacillus glycanilyticus]
MSEFSQSYHLRTEKKEEVITLLKAADRHGYVFEPVNGWVAFTIKDANFNLDEEVMKQNMGLLVHYVYCEDHEWSLSVVDKQEIVFEYNCDWNEDILIQPEQFDSTILHRLPTQPKPEIDLDSLLFITDLDQIFDAEASPAHQIADYIGLTHYDWLSADYISNDPSFYEGVIEV